MALSRSLSLVTYQTEECGELGERVSLLRCTLKPQGETRTVFFLARSPDAPSTTMMVSSFNSMVLKRKAIVSWVCQNNKGRVLQKTVGGGAVAGSLWSRQCVPDRTVDRQQALSRLCRRATVRMDSLGQSCECGVAAGALPLAEGKVMSETPRRRLTQHSGAHRPERSCWPSYSRGQMYRMGMER